jgi:hypothetical protein
MDLFALRDIAAGKVKIDHDFRRVQLLSELRIDRLCVTAQYHIDCGLAERSQIQPWDEHPCADPRNAIVHADRDPI